MENDDAPHRQVLRGLTIVLGVAMAMMGVVVVIHVAGGGDGGGGITSSFAAAAAAASLGQEEQSSDENNPTTTFIVHTQCLSRMSKKQAWGMWGSEREFFNQKITGARIVRNNVGEQTFFSPESALKMERVKLGDDGEYGYKLTTDGVDAEWGFALEREDGQAYFHPPIHPSRSPIHIFTPPPTTVIYYKPAFTRLLFSQTITNKTSEWSGRGLN